MSFFKEMQSRKIQKKANNFIKSLDSKSAKEVEQAYLDNKEFENNEIVLSYLFFKQPQLIRILPLDFQVSRLNSNLTMFEYGSVEAKRKLVLSWFSDNKFFTNANAINLSEEEYESYIKLYFQQPKDVAKLFMVDMRTVIEVLSKADIKKTEEIIAEIKDDLTDRQWEFIIDACPLLIKYASQEIQNKYAEDEKYNKFINGEAREKFIQKQVDLLKDDISKIKDMPIDVQCEYINKYSYMINSIDSETLVNLLQYDIDLIRNINISSLKNPKDHSLEIVYGLLSNIESYSIKEIINIMINKGLMNAKGKLYRFDKSSNDCSYQYTTQSIEIIQRLNVEQIVSLIRIDANYILPYVAPLFYSDYDSENKEKVIIDCNSRCLSVFKAYFGEEIYENYYKVINKIYNEYLTDYIRYDFTKDYSSLVDLLKVLFNKQIITKNNVEKVTVFIGMSLLYKSSKKRVENNPTIKLLNDMLSVAYDKDINVSCELYRINSLELFDSKFDFISPKLLNDYNKYNFLNISSLLFIVKSKKGYELFKKYYKIVCAIHGESKETLFKACENFHYYIDILRDIDGKELTAIQESNLVDLLATYANNCRITNTDELSKYDILLLKKLVGEISVIKDENVYKNLVCTYLFNRGYDQKGNIGLLDSDTIKEMCDIFDENLLIDVEENGECVFSDEEINLFKMIKLMFDVTDSELLFTYLDTYLTNKVDRNIVSIISFFNKLKKYRLDIINNQIVTLDEIEFLCENNPSIAKKSNEDGVDIYTVIGQDFKVLYSTNNDGIHYYCRDVSSLTKNCYGYNKLINTGSIRFTTKDDMTIIKINKDNYYREKTFADFIVIPSKLNDDIIRIAKDNNLKIVVVRE